MALAFTILGLAIQTAHFGPSLVSDVAELSGWVALLLAGIIGLERIQSAYVIYDVYADIATLESERRYFEQLQQQGIQAVPQEGGGTVSPEALIQDRDATITRDESKVGKINKNQGRTYQAQRIIFVAGLTLLMVSRGYQPFLTVLQGSVVYRCTDSRTKLPVFFEVGTNGFTYIRAHDRDGNVYVFMGKVPDYSPISNSEIYYQDPSHESSFGLSPKTGSFYVSEKGNTLFSGTCGF